jgi:hypothetical protein
MERRWLARRWLGLARRRLGLARWLVASRLGLGLGLAGYLVGLGSRLGLGWRFELGWWLGLGPRLGLGLALEPICFQDKPYAGLVL